MKCIMILCISFHALSVLSADCAAQKSEDACRSQYGCMFATGKCAAASWDEKLMKPATGIKAEGEAAFKAQAKSVQEKLPKEMFDKLEGVTFNGGGLRAEFKWWGALHGIFNNFFNLKKIEDFFKDKVVSTNSGGGWFFSDIMYDETVGDSFKLEEDKFEKSVEKRMAVFDQFWYNGTASFFDKHTPEAVRMIWKLNALYAKDPKAVDLWKKFVENIHGDYSEKSRKDMKGVTWYSIAHVLSKGRYNIEEQQSHFPQFDTNQPDATVLPIFFKFDLKNHENPTSEALIPSLDSIEGDKITVESLGAPRWWLSEAFGKKANELETVQVTKESIKKLLIDSMNDVKTYSGPSSDAAALPGAGTNAQAQGLKLLNTAMSMHGLKWIDGKLDYVSWVWRTKPVEGLKVGLDMIDGGPLDNTGLIGAVLGLQHKKVDKAKILCIGDGWDSNFPIFFEEKPVVMPDEMWKPHPYSWIFEKYVLTNMIRTEEGINIYIWRVKTRENKNFGIKAGSFFEVIGVDLQPKVMVDHKATAALPGIGQSKYYVAGAMELSASFKKLSKTTVRVQAFLDSVYGAMDRTLVWVVASLLVVTLGMAYFATKETARPHSSYKVLLDQHDEV